MEAVSQGQPVRTAVGKDITGDDIIVNNISMTVHGARRAVLRYQADTLQSLSSSDHWAGT